METEYIIGVYMWVHNIVACIILYSTKDNLRLIYKAEQLMIYVNSIKLKVNAHFFENFF